MLQLGRDNGWTPLGTAPLNPIGSTPCDGTYEPGDWGSSKRMLAEDAVALADALERALSKVDRGELSLAGPSQPRLLRAGMTEQEFIAANRGLSPEFLRDFIAFLRRGTFWFNWDD